jgi:hypothetical protein
VPGYKRTAFRKCWLLHSRLGSDAHLLGLSLRRTLGLVAETALVKTAMTTASTTTTAIGINSAVGPGISSLMNLVAYPEPLPAELKALWRRGR